RNRKTGDYSFGADQLFERDDFGADYMKGMNPWPKLSVEQSNELFNRVGSLLNEVFSYAKNMGIQTCIGTEIPLVIPGPVQDRLESAGQDPDNPGVISDLYESMFKRIIQTHPLDYYWFWTPEGWTWKGNTKEQIEKTKNDMAAAIAAANNVQAPFTLATCGWVLGPKQDRSMFDKFLPKEMPISCINREVGFTPVETGFSEVKNRPKWAIPWLEDDPAMIIPQLWAGRMRKDAADALIYGCTGLIGIHWRTRILGPNISALAKAAWEQEAWNPSFGDPSREKSDKSRDLTVEEFYNDWAFTQFGREAADPIAEIFIRLDGSSEIQEKNPRKSNLPRPSDWNKGPGGIFPDSRKWEEVSPEYDFILEIEKLRPHVFGKGNLERFDYWLNNFRYMKAIGRFNCTLQEMIEKMNKVKEENDPQLRKNLVQKLVLPIRKRQMAELEEIHKYLLATVNTTGGLGVVANWQQHNIPMHIDPISKELKAISGKDLPEDAMPSKKYPGKVRMFVPTIRTCLEAGEPLHLKIILLGDKSRKAFLYWKPIGENNFEKLKLTYVERGVYRVTIPSEAITEDFEYYIQM
ncbi:MAG: hypothetical protein KAX11_07120, partial [Candidatus Aminicenantes bacterium]|nr:hypothetical protein [Candidatus Aminicenantes bacterium]